MPAGKKTLKPKKHALKPSGFAVESPEFGSPTLTVGQIVEQLGPLAPDPPAMNERIRHWTREGLLHPIGQHHAGTGKHRQYENDARFDAAVLNALGTAGLQVVSRPYVKDILSEARKALQKLDAAARAQRKLPFFFLAISHDTTQIGGEPTATLYEGTFKSDPTADITIVINLSRLFEQMKRKET